MAGKSRSTGFRAATSRGGGLTPARRSKTRGNTVVLTQGPYKGATAKLNTPTSGGGFRATISGLGEAPNTALLTKREVATATYPKR